MNFKVSNSFKSKYLAVPFMLLTLVWRSASSVQLSTPKKYLPVDNNEDHNYDLSFLIFGTSVSWGARLSDRFKESYPYILSSKVMNLSLRASDPSYPSMCTQSMVHSQIYDVIIIEYDRGYRLGLSELTHRLRRRFPEALIILMKTWCLMNVNVNVKIESRDEVQKLRTWLRSNGFEKNQKEAHEFVSNIDNNEVEFSFDEVVGEGRDIYMEQLSKETDAIVYSWDMGGPLKQLISQRMPMFQDFTHWNKIGHEIVASDIKQIIDQNTDLVKHCSADGTGNDCRIGDWGDGDACSNWIESSKASPLMKTNDNIFFSVNKFDSSGSKYAIPFPLKINEFHIKNPFQTSKCLSLTYMSTDKKSNQVYPQVKVSIIGASGSKESETELEPLVSYDFPVHVQKTTQIGIITPGWNKVEIEILSKSENPFRLVGFAITNGKMAPSKIFEQEGFNARRILYFNEVYGN